MVQKNTDNKSILDFRLDNPDYVSDVELAARYAIDVMNAPERFLIGYTLDRKLVLYTCNMRVVKGKSLFCIASMTVIKHKIGKLLHKIQEKDFPGYNSLYDYSDGRYSFDDYYEKWLPIEGLNDKILEQLVNDEIERGLPVYLIDEGCIVQHFSYRYTLQKFLSSMVIMLSNDYLKPAFKDEYKHLYLYPEKYEQPIQLYGGEASLSRYSKRNDELFCVPLTEESLNSEFWNGRLWRDIMPITAPDGDICGIPVKYVTIKTYLDGYQNIYVSVYDINGKPLKNSVLDNAFKDEKNNDSSTLLTNTVKEDENAVKKPADVQGSERIDEGN